MALFGSKKKDTKQAASKKEKTASVPAEKKSVAVAGVKDVLVRPRITEKAANLTSQNVYTFDVRKSANKKEVMTAVKKLYKVTPIKVRMVNIPAKVVRFRTKRGFGKTTAGRKAYVYLKKGDQIQFS